MKNQYGGNDPQFLRGQTVLDYYSFKDASAWGSIGYLYCFFVVFVLLIWISLRSLKYQSR
jgi:hypothetical protein